MVNSHHALIVPEKYYITALIFHVRKRNVSSDSFTLPSFTFDAFKLRSETVAGYIKLRENDPVSLHLSLHQKKNTIYVGKT